MHLLQKFFAPILIATTLFTSTVNAQQAVNIPPPPTPIPGEVSVGAAISPMRKGQMAPFTGVHLSPIALATVLTELKSVDERITIEVKRVRGEDEAQCTFKVSEVKTTLTADNKIMKASLEERERRLKILEERLADADEDRPDVLLWSALGFGLGAGMTILTAFAVSSASK